MQKPYSDLLNKEALPDLGGVAEEHIDALKYLVNMTSRLYKDGNLDVDPRLEHQIMESHDSIHRDTLILFLSVLLRNKT